MKGFFQLVHPMSGVRSSAVSRNRKDFADFLAANMDRKLHDLGTAIRRPNEDGIVQTHFMETEEAQVQLKDCFVVVLVELPDAEEQMFENTVEWMFSQAPLMKVETFVNNFRSKANG